MQVFADIVQVIKEPWGRVAPDSAKGLGKDAPEVSTFSFGATTESQNAKV